MTTTTTTTTTSTTTAAAAATTTATTNNTYSPVVAFSMQSSEHRRHSTVSLLPVPSHAVPTGNISASHTVQLLHAESSVVPRPSHCVLRCCPASHEEKAHAVHSDTSVAVVPSQLAERYLRACMTRRHARKKRNKKTQQAK
jgi:hypothetical protein